MDKGLVVLLFPQGKRATRITRALSLILVTLSCPSALDFAWDQSASVSFRRILSRTSTVFSEAHHAVRCVPSSLQLRQSLSPRQAWRWSQHHLQWLRVKTAILHRLQLCYLRGILHKRHHSSLLQWSAQHLQVETFLSSLCEQHETRSCIVR